MKKRIILLGLVLFFAVPRSHAQWTVIDPSNLAQNIISALKSGATASNTINSFKEAVKIYEQGKEYYDALKKVNNLVKDARKVQQTLLMINDISGIYVNGFRRMTNDPYFTVDELGAIAEGYSILLGEAANVLDDLKKIVNVSTLSMSDKDRIDIIDQCYNKVYEYRALTQYFTNKTIGVSWLRAKKKNDTDRILSLYGSPGERYW